MHYAFRLSRHVYVSQATNMHVRTIIHVNIFVEQSILLAKSAIELLSEIVEWAVTKTLEEYVDALIDVVCAYLQVYLRIIPFIPSILLFFADC